MFLETPLEGPSQTVNETGSEDVTEINGITLPEGNGHLNTQETSSEIPPQAVMGETQLTNEEQPITESSTEITNQLVYDATQSQNSAIDEDGQSLPKTQRLDPSDVISAYDSGIGTCTEGSQDDGTIPNRRKTLVLTPPSAEIENELEGLPVSYIKEMTNLSEKVTVY